MLHPFPIVRHVAVLAVAGAIAGLPAVALAHGELVSSDPAAGANLEVAPSEVTLTFDDELDPDRSGFTVTDHDGDEVGSGEVDLDVADRNVLRGEVHITEPGAFIVDWTILGLDGHEVSGSFSFGYQSEEEIPQGGGDDHESPDTAMADRTPTTPLPAAIIGALLVVLAATVAIRRSSVR